MAFDYLQDFSKFATVNEMDQHVNDHLTTHQYDLTKSTLVVARTLQKMALSFPGACIVRIEKLAEKTNLSVRTIHRAINELKKKSILAIENTKKKNGIKAANIFYFLPFDTSEMAYRHTDEKPHYDNIDTPKSESVSLKSFNLLKQENIKDNYIYACAYLNDFQKTLFDLAYTLYPAFDKTELNKMVLAATIENAKDFVHARNQLLDVLDNIQNGLIRVKKSARSIFAKALQRKREKSVTTEKPVVYTSPASTFYDWLEIRESEPPKSELIGSSSLYNWLEDY